MSKTKIVGISNISGGCKKWEYFSLPPRKETQKGNIHGLHIDYYEKGLRAKYAVDIGKVYQAITSEGE